MSGSRFCTSLQITSQCAKRLGCQCPMSGSRLCTVLFQEKDGSITAGVNALCRAHVSALCTMEENNMAKRPVCQCPMSGSRLCTACFCCRECGIRGRCQCPMSGSRLCTRWTLRKRNCDLICVNALCRALVSAPCPLKTPVFMRVSDPVFLCIYLNCQIFGYNKVKKWADRKLYFKNTIWAVFHYSYYTPLITPINPKWYWWFQFVYELAGSLSSLLFK